MDDERRVTSDARLAFAAAVLLLASACALWTGRPQPRAGFAPEPFAVDVNSAARGEIEALPGVGRVLAERIVATRSDAAFAAEDDLARVPGVGSVTLARMRPFVRCGGRR
jgi:competence protein ComEA